MDRMPVVVVVVVVGWGWWVLGGWIGERDGRHHQSKGFAE